MFQLPSQSAPTILKYVSGRPDNFLGSGTLKKRSKKVGCKKQVAIKIVIVTKKKDAAWPFLFMNNNEPVFCTLFFSTYFFFDFFSGSQADRVFKTRIMSAD